jgi:CheY-like chemotaxis protein
MNSEMAPGAAKPPPLVLVVDDVAHGREICAEYLEFRGFRVATAEDGEEALEKAFDLLPDVILMDLSLPRLDGWEATRRLKQDERTRAIPVIALTAHALASAHEKAKAVGCDAVVTKPCLPKDLEAEVRRQLDARGDRAGSKGAENRS